MTVNPKLLEAWKKRSQLRAEAKKLSTENYSSDAEGNKIYIESCVRCLEGDLVFINAVIEVYGKDICIRWENRENIRESDCQLSNGEVYTVEMGRE